MALKILLKGSSPSKEVVEKVLNKQELKEVEFLSSDQTAGQDYLLLENATNLNYDFKYLIGQARARGQGETELLEYRENGGQELELLGPDFVRNEAKVLSSDYFDGHQGTGIRYFLASGEGRFGIASTAHKNELIEVEHRPCLFLDRDGIINEEGDYPHKISQIIFKEELFPILKILIEEGAILVE